MVNTRFHLDSREDVHGEFGDNSSGKCKGTDRECGAVGRGIQETPVFCALVDPHSTVLLRFFVPGVKWRGVGEGRR